MTLTGTKMWGSRAMGLWLEQGAAEARNLIIKVTLAVVPEETA